MEEPQDTKSKEEEQENSLKIGDLELCSTDKSILELAGLSLELLKKKEVKNYLEQLKLQRINSNRGYFG
jgi:hypothetical protein